MPAHHTEEMTERMIRVEGKLDKVTSLLDGGDTPEHGIIVRLDRIEQKMVARASNADQWKAAGLLVGLSSLASGITWVIAKLTGKG